MKRALSFAQVSSAIVVCVLLTTCGSREHRAPIEPQTPQTAPGFAAFPLEDTLERLDTLPTPVGVDEALWVKLKDTLKEALAARGEGKLVCTPPMGEANRVNDLAIADNGDGTFTLSWHYRNLGDYDQDGVVGLEDIIPLAEHFGETYEVEDENCIQAVIDGSGNGRIGIEDITPIAINFAVNVDHYAVEGAAEETGSYEPVTEVAQDAGCGDGRLAYSAVIESPAALWHRVVPCDSEGSPGEASNAVLRPSNEPIIYEVSPTEGYQHEEYTFSATVSGVEPLTYAWDFGGGAFPDTSAEPSPTVTLADAGVYAATLNVTNAYGEASFPFTLTVSERDIWAHTWGGNEYDYASALAIDSQGNLYVAGSTFSFGAGPSDVLLLKYDQAGNLIFAKTWGGEEPDASWDQGKVSIAIDSSDNVYVASETDSFGAGTSDSLLLRYDTDGELIWARTWGGDWIEHVSGLGTDSEGNVYVAGYRAIEAFASWDIFVLKYSPVGELQHAIGWDSGLMDEAADMAVDAQGNCYVAGKVYDIAASGNRALVVSFDGDGTLRWARAWGTDGNDDEVEGVALGQDAMLHCIGWTHYAGKGRPLLLRYELEGTLISANTVYAAEGVSLTHAAKDAKGNLLIVGAIREEESEETDALITIYRPGETNLTGAAWGSQDSRERARALAVSGLGDLYVTGVAPNTGGTWRLVDMSLDSVNGVISSLEGIAHIAEGIEGFPEGIETLPEGIEDTGGGGYYGPDVLILKNYPQ